MAPGSLASRLHISHVNTNAPVPAAKRTLVGVSFGLELNIRNHIGQQLNGCTVFDLLP